MSWTAKRFSGGWHIGYYPNHDTDWQLSLCHQSFSCTYLDFGKGETRHDWRINWESRNRPDWLTLRNHGPDPRFTFGRLKVTNWADQP